MPLPSSLLEIVSFVRAARGAEGEITPIGTAFFVGVKSTTDPDLIYQYVVTASHVIRGDTEVFIRLRTPAGVEDRRVDEWYTLTRPGVDIAVAPVRPGGQPQKVWDSALSCSIDDSEPPWLGDMVYFVGLLSFVPSMAQAGIPMVRSGTLGAVRQEGVRLVLPGAIHVDATAHLIDCRAHRGFSGAPCFVQSPDGTTRLLGVISSHFDLTSPAAQPAHSGVGVVAMAEDMLEILNLPKLANERAALDRVRERLRALGLPIPRPER